MIADLARDFRVGFRALRKRPLFTVIAATTLALGIGANTAIFSVVYAFLLRDLPYPDADRLVVVWGTDRARGDTETRVSYPDFEDWREQNESFEDLAAFFAFPNGDVNLTGGADPERVPVARVSSGYFGTLGAPMLYGRGFLPEENVAGQHRVAVLSHALWQRQFGGDPAALGQAVNVNGFPYTVIGILSPEFRALGTLALGEEVELWRPIAPDDNQTGGRGSRNLRVVGRLKPGVTAARAQADLNGVSANLEAAYPKTNEARGVRVVPLREQVVSQTRPALLALLGSVALVLLIACANVANLLLARAAGRRKEIAVRLSLGARRPQVIRQLLSESVLLGLIGGAGGLVLAYGGIQILRATGPADLPLLREIGVNGTVLLFAAVVAVLTGLLFGLVPALQASKPNLTGALNDGGRGSDDGGGRRIPNALIVSELAITLVLLIAAGLLVTSFTELLRVDPGFEAEGVLTFQLELPMGTKYPRQEQREVFFRDLMDRLEQHPDVSSASMVTSPPMTDEGFSTTFTVSGAELPPDQAPMAEVRFVAPKYFETLGIPLLDGRVFTLRDGRGGAAVGIVNEAALRYWPEGMALGGNFSTGFRGGIEVVGVVKDVREDGLDADAPPTLYLPANQFSYNFMTVVLRTASDPMALVPMARAAVRELDAEQPIHNIRTMDEVISRSVAERRFQLALLGAFSGLALVLALVGIYGVVAFAVSQRRTEIGVRLALGADEQTILTQLTGESLRLALIGVAIGVPAAVAITRLLSAGLFGVGALDPATYLTAAVFLVLAVLLATAAPAWRASTTDPAEALRAD